MRFTDQIFGKKDKLTFDQYSHLNKNVSSEMFTSLMRVLHENLPCSRNFFSLKKKYRIQQSSNDEEEGRRNIREIASPRIVRGLSIGGSPTRRGSSRGSDG